MAVKIFIRRRLKDSSSDMEKASDLLIQARTNAMGRQGYISSETLRGCDDGNEILVVSMWEKKQDWDLYKNNPTRLELEEKFDKILDGPTVYSAYNLGINA